MKQFLKVSLIPYHSFRFPSRGLVHTFHSQTLEHLLPVVEIWIAGCKICSGAWLFISLVVECACSPAFVFNYRTFFILPDIDDFDESWRWTVILSQKRNSNMRDVIRLYRIGNFRLLWAAQDNLTTSSKELTIGGIEWFCHNEEIIRSYVLTWQRTLDGVIETFSRFGGRVWSLAPIYVASLLSCQVKSRELEAFERH